MRGPPPMPNPRPCNLLPEGGSIPLQMDLGSIPLQMDLGLAPLQLDFGLVPLQITKKGPLWGIP